VAPRLSLQWRSWTCGASVGDWSDTPRRSQATRAGAAPKGSVSAGGHGLAGCGVGPAARRHVVRIYLRPHVTQSLDLEESAD